MLLPYAMQYNASVNVQKCIELAGILGRNTAGLSESQAALEAAQGVFDLYRDIGMPIRLREINMKESDIAQAAAATAKIQRILRINPRACGEADIAFILKNAW